MVLLFCRNLFQVGGEFVSNVSTRNQKYNAGLPFETGSAIYPVVIVTEDATRNASSLHVTHGSGPNVPLVRYGFMCCCLC